LPPHLKEEYEESELRFYPPSAKLAFSPLNYQSSCSSNLRRTIQSKPTLIAISLILSLGDKLDKFLVVVNLFGGLWED